MHEISLVRTIFRTLADNFSTEELDRVVVIELKVGPLANVEPVLMQNAFEAVVEEEEARFRKATLQVNTVPVLVHCPACDQTSEVQQYRFVCGNCGNPCANVVQGNELLIERVVFRD
ncbi:MAG: hydrogenase maturation nickel metallochaperone HypA [Saprospiraceae bacterium]|nr:hydrogenase maturation nickel metallochaperone HypA [Saprospiraceae bacterium]